MDRVCVSVCGLKRRAERFARDRRGNFAIVAAVLFIPVLMAVAAAADISLFYSERAAIQSAADAAVLATAKRFSMDPGNPNLEDYAQNVFVANTAGVTRTTSALKYEGASWTPQGTRELRLSVCSSYDPVFLSALNISFTGLKGGDCLKAESVVTLGSTTVEVAFVLDTSGSMKDSPAAGGPPKIKTLKDQATQAINAIFGSSASALVVDPVRIGIVPFSGGVNIGASHLDDWWMDPMGLSPIHHENLDWTDYAIGQERARKVEGTNAWISTADPKKYMTRQLIYKTMLKNTGNPNLAYKGCVESRPKGAMDANYNLTDKPPTVLDPASLFVPFFAPDEPDGYPRNNWTNKYVADSAVSEETARERKISVEELRLKGVNKYFLARTVTDSLGDNFNNSPAYNCDSVSLTPLTGTKKTVLDAVSQLVASGSTNVPQGVEWGWKVLSRNEPFTEGRAAGDENNIKAMIVMTDGQNTYYNDPYFPKKIGKSIFSAYGYSGFPEPGLNVPRLFDYKAGISTALTEDNYTNAMNGRLAAICENAKGDGRIKLKDLAGVQLSDERGPVTRDGILIYTIAFDIPRQYQAMVNGLLSGCASYRVPDLRNTGLPYKAKAKYFYSASNAKDLQNAFNDITASLTGLRLSR